MRKWKVKNLRIGKKKIRVSPKSRPASWRSSYVSWEREAQKFALRKKISLPLRFERLVTLPQADCVTRGNESPQFSNRLCILNHRSRADMHRKKKHVTRPKESLSLNIRWNIDNDCRMTSLKQKRGAEIMTHYSWTYEQGKVERANLHISAGIEEDFKNHWERGWRNREFLIAKEGREHANMRKT